MDWNEISSKKVSDYLGRKYADCYRVSIVEAMKILDDAEDECLKIDDSSVHEQEVKRRISEFRLRTLCDHNAPINVVAESRDDLHKLGYTNIETEISLELYFSVYCESVGEIDIAKSTVDELFIKAKTAIQLIKDKESSEYSFYMYYLNDFQGRIDRLMRAGENIK